MENSQKTIKNKKKNKEKKQQQKKITKKNQYRRTKTRWKGRGAIQMEGVNVRQKKNVHKKKILRSDN